MIIWCMVPQIWSVKDRTFMHFGSFFAVYPPPSPNNLENQDFEKMKNILKKWKKKKEKKNTWRCHHFIHVYQKLLSHNVRFLRYGAWQTDGRTEKVTYRGGAPLKTSAKHPVIITKCHLALIEVTYRNKETYGNSHIFIEMTIRTLIFHMSISISIPLPLIYLKKMSKLCKIVAYFEVTSSRTFLIQKN